MVSGKRGHVNFIVNALERSLETFLFAGVLVMIATGTAQIIFRYFLQTSLSWSEELMRFLYVWLTMFGAPLAVRRRQFTSIEIVSNLLGNASAVLKKALLAFAFTMQTLFFALLIYYGWQLVTKNIHNTSPAMGVSMGLAYSAMFLGGILGVVYCGITIWEMAHKETKA